MTSFKFIVLLGLFSFGSVWADKKQTRENRVFCNARTWGAHVVNDARCKYWDEVLVGIKSVDPMAVICARLDVSCPNRPTEKVVQKESVPETEALGE